MVDIKKKIKYQKEQKEILDQLLKLLNFNGSYTFTKDALENDRELQENILSLKEDIKKYYASSVCKGLYNQKANLLKRNYFSIINFILKVNDIELNKEYIKIKINDKRVSSVKYKINL